MLSVTKKILMLGAIAVLSSCGSGSRGSGNTPQTSGSFADPMGNPDLPAKLGEAFKVGSITYKPADVAQYDDVGYASISSVGSGGNMTANGEIFLASGVSAAHKTLPMPTYVEVTALDTGRTILVRVNDRGPLANDRLIDLSEGAARQLGIVEQGIAGVRVRKVNPPEQDRSVLRAGQPAAVRVDTPNSLLRVLRDKFSKMPRPNGAPAVIAPRPTKVVTSSPTYDDRQPVRYDAPGAPYDASSAAESETVVDTDGRFVREGNGSGRVVATKSTTNPVKRSPARAPIQENTGGDEFVREGGGVARRRRFKPQRKCAICCTDRFLFVTFAR